jgi:starch synthase
LNQIYSLKYGTVPVVRATGGLDDTIEPFDGKSGTGFKFHEYTPQALLSTIQTALDTYASPKIWQRLMQNGMKKDYSWASSAKAYAQIYQDLRKAMA